MISLIFFNLRPLTGKSLFAGGAHGEFSWTLSGFILSMAVFSFFIWRRSSFTPEPASLQPDLTLKSFLKAIKPSMISCIFIPLTGRSIFLEYAVAYRIQGRNDQISSHSSFLTEGYLKRRIGQYRTGISVKLFICAINWLIFSLRMGSPEPERVI